MFRAILLILCAVLTRNATAQVEVIDRFENAEAWSLIAADGVGGAIVAVDGALRLDYDFSAGAGYCVARRRVDLPLDPNYRFGLRIRGQGPKNTLEFKLVDPSGENVWWNVHRDAAFPDDWTPMSLRRRHFSFAWGPSGGAELERAGYIEIAVTASGGGAGSLWLDDLYYERLPDSEPQPVEPAVRSGDGTDLGRVGPDGSFSWNTGPNEEGDSLTFVFDDLVEFSAIELEWSEGGSPSGYSLEVSSDGTNFRTVGVVRSLGTNPSLVFTPESEARAVRCVVEGPGKLNAVRFLPVEELQTANDYFAVLASRAARGAYPPYFGELSAWTVIGLPGSDAEALVSAAGAVEPIKGGYSLEPFLVTESGVLTWADATIDHSLEEGSLPIPSVRWTLDGLRLDITAIATDTPAGDHAVVRYRVSNTGSEARSLKLALAVRPFQVLPAAQFLNTVGGSSRAQTLDADSDRVRVDGRDFAMADRSFDAVVSTDAPSGSLVASLTAIDGRATEARSDGMFPCIAMIFDLAIEPGASDSVVVTLPMREGTQEPEGSRSRIDFDHTLSRERERWRQLLGHTDLLVPDSAAGLRDTVRANLAYILIHSDGAGIQPGSRTYERSWIRDGAMTSAALIATGHAADARAFIEWYAGYQYADGKVPCVVDRRGPDPVDENDAPGEFLFALRNSIEAGGVFDDTFARSVYPNVVAAVEYIGVMRRKRLTEAYTDSDDPILRACAGLMPESISHEGYSAKPMHSYWDDFWVYRGLRDAAVIADRLGEHADGARFSLLADEFGDAVARSVEAATIFHGIDYVPGCVELGDFDATSTSIAFYPTGAASLLDRSLLESTFERAWRATDLRIRGEAWDGMTPYEVRIIGTFVRLGWLDRAHAYLDWLMQLRDPAGWRQWGEIAYRERRPSRFVGDMPHTWVGSGAILSIFSMFAYEQDNAMVLAAGIPTEWLDTDRPIGVRGLVTRFGILSFEVSRDDDRLLIQIDLGCRPPAGFRIDIGRLMGVPDQGSPGGRLRVMVDGTLFQPDERGMLVIPSTARRIEAAR